jgi:nucleoside-diphosphate-sugar epimerase|tara:strand:+ start:7316 stop:8356 length:1041 start_codon:yes stop_codon:yes gene_type:complete
MKQTILVTGGTGYVGSWVVKGLLENGHKVRLTVREISQKNKYQFLIDIADNNKGSIEFWEADLLKMGSFDDAAKGCDSIAHIASPFKLNVKNAQEDLVDPAVIGTTNVLDAANKSDSVKKVVLTSSVVAIYGDNIDMKYQDLSILTEAQYNTSSTLAHQPYAYSKVKAEKKAWAMAKEQSNWELVVMNPSFVMGPSLTSISESESLKFMTELLKGKFKMGSAEIYMGYVDVRDVAKAHIFGLENKVEGRFILSERVTDMLSFSNIIGTHYGEKYGLPKSNNPKWLLSLIGGFFGLSRKYVKNNIGIPIKLDSSKSIDQLKLNYTPLEQTMKDMVEKWESFKKLPNK